jgi:hypothetical protein
VQAAEEAQGRLEQQREEARRARETASTIDLDEPDEDSMMMDMMDGNF